MVDYQAILSQIPKRFPNTCSWILEADAFKRWARGEGSSVLWLRGYPRLGKSVIAKYFVDEVLGADWTGPSVRNSHRNDPIVVYFFCSYRDSQARSLKSLLSSLLHQLLYQKPELSRGIRKRYETLSQSLTESVWNLWSMLEDVILEIPQVYPTAPTPGATFVPPPKNLYIVVDALDELHKTEWGPFCDRFFEILKRNQNAFRLVVTSRKEPDIEQQLATAWCLDLSSTNQNASDVAEYLRTSVSTYGKENNFSDEVVHTIISELTRGAKGMFLWASLAWSYFTGGVGTWTRTILQQRLQDLQHLPPGMETLYHRILVSVDSRNQAELLEALQWIVAAARPLTTDEIGIALALRKRPRKKRYIDIRLNILAFFKRTCPHLVKVSQSGIITLVHLSFRDYLLESLEINNGTECIPNTFHIDLTRVNFEVGLDCLSYIVLDDFVKERFAVVSEEHKFFNYAYHNWLGHLAGRNDRASEIWVYFIRLIDHKTKLLRWYDTNEVIISLWAHSLFRLFEPAVEFGMDLNVADMLGDHFIHLVVPEVSKFPLESVKFLTGLGLNINGRTRFGQTLLQRCIAEWQDEMSSLLHSAEDQIYFDDQDGEDNVSSDTGTGEHCSTERTLYDLLSFPGIDPNAMDDFGYTPLSFAIHQGLDRVVAILLTCPQLDIAKGFEALHVAAKGGVVSAVECLLSRDVNVSEKTKYGETALHLAASNGHLRVLKLLASKSPLHVFNAKDHNGWTATHRAVTSGNEDLVLWLIQQPNINLDLKDKHGRRAIAFAAAYGTEAMLKAFLERRPDDITHLDSFGNTLFHMAATGSNQRIFSFLYSFCKQGRVARPGANKWGKTVVDLARTPDIEKYLRGLGFAHSERYLSHCDELSVLNLQAMAEKTTIPTCSNTSMELIRHSSEDSRDSRPGEMKVSESSKTDRLGWRFNSIYAID
jgi:ankyrin repeat protein